MKTLAKIISAVGNPITLAVFFGLYISIFTEDKTQAGNSPLIYIFIIALIVGIYVFVNVRLKKFNNYDVSNRLRRNSVYKLLIALFLILNAIFYFGDFSPKAHITISFLINQKIKISMHTSFNFLFAFLFYPFNPIICYSLFVFGFINAWSRLKLSRHSISEVGLGFLIGNLIGVFYLITLKYYL